MRADNNENLSDEELSEMTFRYISSLRFIIPTKSILDLEMKIQNCHYYS